MAQLPVTQAQKHFIINNAYKRSRRYFDIVKLNHMEHQQQVQRRIPLSTKQTIQSRVGQSFISSDELLHDKVANDLNLFHKKGQHDEADEVQTTYTARTNKPKTVDMHKMLARSDFDKSKLSYRNEQQFNNYFQSHSKPRMSLDFQKIIGRGRSSSRYQDDPQEQNSQRVSKIYQKLIFDQANSSCFVDYKNKGKFKPKPLVDQIPSYQPSKVRKGDLLTKKNPFAQQLYFYHGYGKSDPSQLDNRLSKENQYFWRGVREEREKLKDFAAHRREQEQQRKKIESVLARKKPTDDRSQMCDERFFKRQQH